MPCSCAILVLFSSTFGPLRLRGSGEPKGKPAPRSARLGAKAELPCLGPNSQSRCVVWADSTRVTQVVTTEFISACSRSVERMCIVVVSVAYLWHGYEKTDFCDYTTTNQLHFHGEQKASITVDLSLRNFQIETLF